MDFTSRLKIYQTRCKKEDEESMCWNKNTWDFSCNSSFLHCHLSFLVFQFPIVICHPQKIVIYHYLLKECGFERSPLTKRQSARFVLKTVFSTFPERKF